MLDYLYHPPRKYKGTAVVTKGTIVPLQTTVEVILVDSSHNTLGITIAYIGLEQPIRDKRDFAATIERGIFVIPDSGGNAENTLHFRITPGALVLIDPPTSSGVYGIPDILYEEKS